MSAPPVVLDTNCWIYYLDDAASQRGAWLGTQVIRAAAHGRLDLVTATVSLAELLVRPHRTGGPARAAALQRALAALPGSRVADLTADLAARAAGLRATTALRLPDAIVLATASAVGGRLLTNDRALAAAADPATVLLLDDLLDGPLP